MPRAQACISCMKYATDAQITQGKYLGSGSQYLVTYLLERIRIMFNLRLVFCSLLVVLAICIAGCKSQAEKASPAKDQPADNAAVKETSADNASTDVPAGLAELSAEDRQLAEKQRVCPVSGDLLGAMGKPFKTTVNGKTVFLCCQGCEQELKDNPDKYLAKIKTP
jgi:YHS domain-containing protein